jgi:2-polyprenyl-3-methyl-5-hydroxy-6-metoxy-1,4-benzoquinol methylase
MSRLAARSSNASELVRRHFRRKAFSFDALYDEDHVVQRLLRPGLLGRREFALAVIRSYESPRVLDVGCGSGRIGEDVLDYGGAAEYVGIDFSEPMLALATERLARFGPRATLLHGDFRETALDGPYDVILALGLFDYLPEPEVFARRMYELCSGSTVASFPRWTWSKGPIRKLRYEVINSCPIFNYTERELRFLFRASGFSSVDVVRPRRSGFLVRAKR